MRIDNTPNKSQSALLVLYPFFCLVWVENTLFSHYCCCCFFRFLKMNFGLKISNWRAKCLFICQISKWKML